MQKKILIPIGIILLLAAGGAAGFFLFNKEKEPEQEKADPIVVEEVYRETKDNVVKEKEDPYQNEINFDELKAINPDVYAWIKVPGTNIDYPILQSTTESDDYYLNMTMDGKYGLPGSIYTEKYNAQDFSDRVTVIYGHTMHDGTMFSELKKYRDRAFFDQNPYIYIYLPTARLKYQIFATVAFDDRYILGQYNFSNEEDFNGYVSELKSCLDGNVNHDLEIHERIITLSTCIDEFPDQRWLVNAVLVEEQR